MARQCANKFQGQRRLRVGEAIRHALSALMERTNFRDPELLRTSLTITEVRMSPDLRNALVLVLPLGSSCSMLSGLRRIRPFLRYALARMVQLQFVPELSFKVDTRFEEASRIEAILRRPDVLRDLQVHDRIRIETQK